MAPSRSSVATPMWSIRPNIRWSLSGREWIARPALALGLLLDSEDLAERRNADLELLRGRLLGRDQPLDLVAGPMEGPGGGGLRIPLAPGEHLGRQRSARD